MILSLPLPPSSNSLFANVPRRGRVRTTAYKNWIDDADDYFLMQRRNVVPIGGPYAVSIRVPFKMRGDIDNRAKPLLDWLVSRELTADDKHLHRLTIERGDTIGPKMCEIEVREA